MQNPLYTDENADSSSATTHTAAPVYHTPPPPPITLTRDSAARTRMRRRRVKSRRGGEWAWVIVAIAMLGIVVVVSMSVSLLLRSSYQEQATVAPTQVAAAPTPVDARTQFTAAAQGEQVILSDGRSFSLTPWNGVSRFTILAIGLDRRPGETGLAFRTDTMMLVSIDPETNSVGLLSIPRDLYVEVPGYSQLQRVNTPMVLGELRQPGSGPELAMQTVQYNLGIRVHDYVAVDFSAFVRFVDAINGIDIDIPYGISDPLYPDMNFGYDPFYIRAGQQHLDGSTALKYARTRHGDNDFQRAQRQQLVLYAIRDRLLNPELLPQLIVQSPSLWAAVDGNVYTRLTLDQIIQLGLYAKDIPAENIRTGVINQAYTVNYTTPQGAQVLVPDRARLGQLMVEVFGENYSQ